LFTGFENSDLGKLLDQAHRLIEQNESSRLSGPHLTAIINLC